MERAMYVTRQVNCTPSQYSEQVMDSPTMNWYIQSLAVYFPALKRIFIDQKDEDLFQAIDRCPHQKIVVVVNQWHMEGIEHEWAHRYGQLPRSVHFKEGINPIGDMDLRDGLFEVLYNNLHREIASSNHMSTPTTYSNWIIGYHREANF
jgi:hypothetical protein